MEISFSAEKMKIIIAEGKMRELPSCKKKFRNVWWQILAKCCDSLFLFLFLFNSIWYALNKLIYILQILFSV